MGTLTDTRGGAVSSVPSRTAEADFYSRYDWCLNPALTLAQQRQRCAAELSRWESLPDGWERDECAINFYLFACSIACSVGDALAGARLNVAPLAKRVPYLRAPAEAAQRINEAWHWAINFLRDRRAHEWHEQWAAVADDAAELLRAGTPPDLARARRLLRAPLRTRFERRRMRIPELYRCQDMSHPDVFAMARRFMRNDAASGRTRRVLVLGPRTAGVYFAPLVAAVLRAGGYDAGWLVVRPKEQLSWWERQALRRAARHGCRILIVDDHPNTGHTIALLQKLLHRFRIAPERIEAALPLHYRHADWQMPAAVPGAAAIRLHRFEPDEQYKHALLEPGRVEPLLREYFGERGWPEVRILPDDADTAALNAALRLHWSERFEARLKRVYRVGLRAGNRVEARLVIAKSVGWGWLGYHAWFAGQRLAGFVPEILGLRAGLLFMEWAEGTPLLESGDVRWAEAAGRYVGARAVRLRIPEDPCFFEPGFRWVGWNEALSLMKRRYGLLLGALLTPLLRRRLRRYISPVPALTDGRMNRDEWMLTARGPVKIDFEQHNFGGAEFDVVDPAWDLAGAVAAFGHEEAVLRGYWSEVDDPAVGPRLRLWSAAARRH